ncbi:MAG: hypothetical protein JWR35_967 [Marmoricola sp.]|nr:hypothetical protein [Marmoricola sp.]
MTADGTFPVALVVASVEAAVEVPAAASRRVRDLLTGPEREARVLHRGEHALYLELDGWCLGLVSRSATAVPCALALPAAALGPLASTVRSVAGSGRLRLYGGNGERSDVRVGRLVDNTVPRLAALPPAYVVRRMRLAARAAVAELGNGLMHGPELAADELLGRGSGLTPLGDDVIAGWTAAAYALGRPVPALELEPRQRTTLFSATLIDCARRGEVLPEFAGLIRALNTGEPTTIDEASTALAAVGHTSGAGLLLGACLLLESLLIRDERTISA